MQGGGGGGREIGGNAEGMRRNGAMLALTLTKCSNEFRIFRP